MVQHLVTGGAGFIGRHLVRALAERGDDIIVLDDASAGTGPAGEELANLPNVQWVQADACQAEVYESSWFGKTDTVWHLAANPDVRAGADNPQPHFDQNVVMTWVLLEAMRKHGVQKLRFCSTSTIYGVASELPTPETYGPLLPISVYGGAKLACEAMISAHAASFGLDAQLYRFANVVGPEATHGVLVDFVAKLRATPNKLEILGDGKQSKSYVHVADTVGAMLHLHDLLPPGVEVYNIGSADVIDVLAIGRIVGQEMGLEPELAPQGGAAGGGGWVGDVTRMRLCTQKLEATGWKAVHDSESAIRDTVRHLLES